MSSVVTQLEKLYDEYLRDMERITSENLNLREAFSRLFGGSSAGPGSDSCNDRFYEGVKQLTEQLAAEGAPSGEIAEVISCIIHREHRQQCSQSALLMLQAAHGLAVPLVELLEPAASAKLSEEYSVLLKSQALLPAQKQLYEKLKNRAELSNG